MLILLYDITDTLIIYIFARFTKKHCSFLYNLILTQGHKRKLKNRLIVM